MEKEAKIKVQNITKIFGPHKDEALKLMQQGMSKVEILQKTGATVGVNQANFSVAPGEIFVIMGLSGSGKSTLLRMINRLINPTQGAIYIDGENIIKFNKKQLRQLRQKN